MMAILESRLDREGKLEDSVTILQIAREFGQLECPRKSYPGTLLYFTLDANFKLVTLDKRLILKENRSMNDFFISFDNQFNIELAV